MEDSIHVSTAYRVLKGAVTKVLRVPCGGTTYAQRCVSASSGVLGVKLPPDGEPTAAQVAEIESASNAAILEDRSVRFFELTRSDAEARYGSAPFDGYSRRDAVDLTLAWIDGWNLSTVASRSSLLHSTGGLGTLRITGVKFAKGKCDFSFSLSASSVGAAGSATPGEEPFGGPPVDVVAAMNVPIEKKPRAAVAGAAGGGEASAAVSSSEAAVVSAVPKSASAAAPVPRSLVSPAASEVAPAIADADVSGSAATGGDGQVITPWEVDAEDGVDYEKLIVSFGCSRITEDIISRVERITNMRAHRFLRRGLFFSHRDLGLLLDAVERGEPFFLYTGRGPSSEALHLGHLVPFHFTAWLQKAFRAPLVVQLTDDEKFLWKDLSLEECHRLAFENAKDIIACGFDPQRTFIFSDLDYIGHMYQNVLRVQKAVTYSQARGIFGFTGEANIGKVAFPAVQAAPSFSSSFAIPLRGEQQMWCLIPQAIDQDPYFRMTRDVAPRLGLRKPALIHSKFFPALQGSKSKMSSSSATSAIMVTDSAKDIKSKINRYAFSGGQALAEDQRRLGANLEVDVPYQYLRFFMEDDAEVERIGSEYAAGRLLSGEVKAHLVDTLTPMVLAHQAARAVVTDDVVRLFMSVRPLEFTTKEDAVAAAVKGT